MCVFILPTSCTPLFNVVSLQFFKYFKCLYLLVPLICKKFVVILIQNFIIVPTCMREETLQLTERIKSFVHCSCLDELNLLNRFIWFSSRPILLNSQRLTHPIALLFYFSFCNYIHPPHKSALLWNRRNFFIFKSFFSFKHPSFSSTA